MENMIVSGTDNAGTVPLTDAQRGVYFECAENPGTTGYNCAFALDLPASVDPERFAAAVRMAAENHPAFFVTVGPDAEGTPVMRQGKIAAVIGRARAESRSAAKKDFVKPFDLEKGPLYRFELCETPEGAVFLTDVHHLVFDGMTLKVFMNEIAAAYGGRDIEGEKKPYFDAAKELNALHSGEDTEGSGSIDAAREFFRGMLEAGEFDTVLPPDIDGKGTDDLEGMEDMPAGGELSAAVDAFVKDTGIKAGPLFMAAFAYTLSVYTAADHSCFTTVSNGRHGEEVSRTAGMFVRTLPLRFETPENGNVMDYLLKVRDGLRGALRNDCISFSELAGRYGANTDIAFVYQGGLISDITVGGERLMPDELPVRDYRNHLLCMVLKTDSGYVLRVHYRRERYSAAYIGNFCETLLQVLKGFMTCEKLNDIDLVSAAQRAFIDDFNRTETPFDPEDTLQAMFDRACGKYPENTALVFGGRKYTCREFERLTRNIAAYVSGKGIGAEDYAAVLTPRDDTGVLAAWGVIRAGAAVQMLDPAYPDERLNYMVRDSGAKLLIAERELRGKLTEYAGDVLFTDELSSLPEAPGFARAGKPGDAAALIYTSGTTGRPKGAVLENGNLTAFCAHHAGVMGIGADAQIANYASFGFDAGLMDIVSALTCGAALYIIPDEMRLDMARMDAFYRENGITHGFMTTQVARMFAEETSCETLRALLAGGEKLVPFTPKGNFRFINGYGPCETMAYICWHEVKDNSPLQPIGKPAVNTKLYITDKAGRLLPPGAAGELCISGRQVGRGYLGLPEKTASVFVKNPFCADPVYARVYRTGDDARLLPAGELEYIGRRDGQVKIRGFRVELTEVEEVIRRFPGVSDATVAAFEEKSGGGKYLAAYVAGEGDIDIEGLKAFIRGEKPDYMVPAVITRLAAIPYTVNRKVDRRALPVPERRAEAAVPPETDAEKRIFELTAGVLGNEDFGVTNDLFDTGLTSIGALKLNLLIGKATGVPLKIADLREHRTVRDLAAFIENCLKETGGKDEGGNGNGAENASYPLMQSQLGVLLDAGTDGTSTRYNIPLIMRLSPAADAEKLVRAVKTAIDAHPCMKITLAADADGATRAVRNDGAEPVAELIRADEMPAAEELITPFTMTGERLYRARVYVTGKDEKYLFLDVHHIIADGVSVAILLRDISAAYAGEPLEKETFTGFDLALEEEKADRTASLKYYEQLLSGANTECLPAPCPETEPRRAAGMERRSFGEVSSKVLSFCEKHGVSANAFFSAVFGYTLSEFLHAEEVTWCTVFSGRGDARLADSVAMLVRTLPVRFGMPDAKVSPAECVKSMQKQLLDTMGHDDVPFADLHSRFGVKPDIFFNYQRDGFSFDTLCGEPAELLPYEPEEAKAPFSVEIFLKDGVFRAECTYDTGVFCDAFAASFMRSLVTAAEGFAAPAETVSVGAVPVMSGADRKLFDIMNSTSAPFERIPAQALFERAAAAHPESVAAADREHQITFGELNRKAETVAAALRSLGAAPDEIIGLILNRDITVPIIEMGVLKAGSAFLPMLPAYPDDRLEYCLRDAECRFVIAPRSVIAEKKALFGEKGEKPYRALAIEDLTEGRTGLSSEPPAREKGEEREPLSRLAYCIYTSGSTGTPKGVMIEQHSLTGFVQTADLCETLDAGHTVLCMASVSFDMSVTEIFFSLCRGKTVYIAAEEEVHDLDLLLKAFETAKIDLIMMTPSFAWNLLASPAFEPALASVKAVVLGAEAFQPALYMRLKRLNPDMLVQNGYGPTECTQVCSLKTLSSGDHITVGSPFRNTRFRVADSRGNLLPRYAVGELLISGEGVCRGYVKQPEKNAAAFTQVDGERAYRSGDLVRINRDMEVEFAGRKDRQVKLRGFRIELDEVESVMQSFPGVTRAAVIVRNNGKEDFLAGYYTAGETVPAEDLAVFMRTKLTYYMVPAAMMQLDRMPVTSGGKLDRKALPEIRPVKKDRPRRAAKKSLEQKITELFGEILGTEECWPDDNFFEIGGTSLSASRAVMRLKAEGYKAEYQDIFDHQSAAELAEYLEGQGMPDAGSPAAPGTEEKDPFREDDFIAEALKCNSMAYAAQVRREPLGDVLLTGATGFLGAHVLKTLLDTEEGKIVCLLRRGRSSAAAKRLQAMLVYYFEDDFASAFGERVTVIEGDVTDEGLKDKLSGVSFDTVINCAACVKHYANDDSIERVNVGGVRNLIGICRGRNARLIQISTTSVPGMHTEESWQRNVRMPEDRLFVIDDTNNQYIRSKYQAERLVLEAVRDGLRAKIIRVGNLMGRYTDGEFQTNMRTNAFLNGLRGFVNIGKCPISHSTDPMNFSPVDSTARAVVLLSGTNDMFTAFNADSRFTFDEMKVMDTMNRCGIPVIPVQDEEYYADYYRFMADPEKNAGVAALLTSDRPDMHPVCTENRFTANVLYRLGFSWPFVDDEYLERVIRSLDTLAFFSEEL